MLGSRNTATTLTLPKVTAQQDSGLYAAISFSSLPEQLIQTILAFISPSIVFTGFIGLKVLEDPLPWILFDRQVPSMLLLGHADQRGCWFSCRSARDHVTQYLLQGLPAAAPPKTGTQLPALLPLFPFAFPIN